MTKQQLVEAFHVVITRHSTSLANFIKSFPFQVIKVESGACITN